VAVSLTKKKINIHHDSLCRVIVASYSSGGISVEKKKGGGERVGEQEDKLTIRTWPLPQGLKTRLGEKGPLRGKDKLKGRRPATIP